MCGIAGALFWNSEAGRGGREASVARWCSALAHRGPDGEACRALRHRGARPGRGADRVLGHRRLAIIDLTDRAAQPMASPRGPIWLTFNGEIYNFASCVASSSRCGRGLPIATRTPRSSSRATSSGARRLERLRGMFAFALWDGAARGCLLARDRLGIKPLYVDRGRRRVPVRVGGARRCWRRAWSRRRSIRRRSISTWPIRRVPAPRTLVRASRCSRPATSSDDRARTAEHSRRAYWDLLRRGGTHGLADDAATEARGEFGMLLDESAALHLVSDVPVGVFPVGRHRFERGRRARCVRRASRRARSRSRFPARTFDEAPICARRWRRRSAPSTPRSGSARRTCSTVARRRWRASISRAATA